MYKLYYIIYIYVFSIYIYILTQKEFEYHSFKVQGAIRPSYGKLCNGTSSAARFPLFPGQNEMDQIQKIHNVLGTPSPDLLASKFKRRDGKRPEASLPGNPGICQCQYHDFCDWPLSIIMEANGGGTPGWSNSILAILDCLWLLMIRGGWTKSRNTARHWLKEETAGQSEESRMRSQGYTAQQGSDPIINWFKGTSAGNHVCSSHLSHNRDRLLWLVYYTRAWASNSLQVVSEFNCSLV